MRNDDIHLLIAERRAALDEPRCRRRRLALAAAGLLAVPGAIAALAVWGHTPSGCSSAPPRPGEGMDNRAGVVYHDGGEPVAQW